MGQIQRPFPVAMTLAQDDSLLQFSFTARIARLNIKRKSNRVVGGIPQQIPILERDAIELEMGDATRGIRFAKIDQTFVQIQGETVVISEAIFEFMAYFPEIEVILA